MGRVSTLTGGKNSEEGDDWGRRVGRREEGQGAATWPRTTAKSAHLRGLVYRGLAHRTKSDLSDRSVLRLGVKALTHALLIGVCPNFWPLPAGRGDPLYPGGGSRGARDLWPRGETCAVGLPPASCFSVPGAPRIWALGARGFPGHCSLQGGPRVRGPFKGLRWRLYPPPGGLCIRRAGPSF